MLNLCTYQQIQLPTPRLDPMCVCVWGGGGGCMCVWVGVGWGVYVCMCPSQSVFFHVLQVCSTNTGVLHPVAVMSTSVLCHVYQGTVCLIYQCTVCVSCLPVYCLCVMSTSVLSVCHVYQCTVCVLCLQHQYRCASLYSNDMLLLV